MSRALLQLLQLSDSSLPIGATAHSFGLETLAEEGLLDPSELCAFFEGFMEEAGTLEAGVCRKAYHLAAGHPSAAFEPQWLDLNGRVSALKPGREARAASGTLGRRLLQLASSLEDRPAVRAALRSTTDAGGAIHQSAAFGLVGGAFGLGEEETVLGYLSQSLAGWVSACQRLMPVGQTLAARLLWNLKPAIHDAAERSRSTPLDEIGCFVPLIDLGSMRHPMLATRLFIS